MREKEKRVMVTWAQADKQKRKRREKGGGTWVAVMRFSFHNWKCPGLL